MAYTPDEYNDALRAHSPYPIVATLAVQISDDYYAGLSKKALCAKYNVGMKTVDAALVARYKVEHESHNH